MKTRMASWATISPKVIAAVVTAVVTYLLAQEAVDWPAWVEVTGQAVLVALAAYAAPPGRVVAERAGTTYASDRGFVTTDFILGALVVAVIAILIIVL